MKQVFSDYVRSLSPDGEPSDAALDRVWTELRRLLRRSLQRRGLWDRPPGYLGMVGHSAWTTRETADRRGFPAGTLDALDELVHDFYVWMFVERLASLRRYVAAGDAIEKVVHRGLQQFLLGRQKRQDPVGYRLYQRLVAALERALRSHRLHVLEGGTKIHNGTVFAFDPETEAAYSEGGPAGDEVLAPEVRRWNDELFPDWVTVQGAAAKPLIAELSVRILGLAAAGVEVFVMKPLIDAVKRDARDRLAALWEILKPEAEDSAEQRAVEIAGLAELSVCVEERLRRLRVQERTREKLRRLWRFLEAFGLEAADPESALGVGDRLAAALWRATLPANRELGRLLGIRHDRIPELLARLREEVERCLGRR